MDVRCERCNMEYEFDDALVSGRGTTVKCTNCGHKFKIRRPDGDYSEDFWNVATHDGKTLVFTSLRELQRAIQTHQIERSDKISRGGRPPKNISQISELVPFFDQRDREEKKRPSVPMSAVRSSRPPPPPGATGPALAAPPRVRQSTLPDFTEPSVPGAEPPGGRQSTLPDFTTPPAPPPPAPHTPGPNAPLRRTLSGISPTDEPSATPASPPMRPRMSSAPPLPETEPTPAPAPPPEPEPAPAPVVEIPQPTPPPPPFEASSPLPPPAPQVLRAMGRDADAYSDSMRTQSPSLPDAPVSVGRRRSVGGFIVVAALLAGVGILGAVWARDHLGATLGLNKPLPPASADPRVAAFLSTGERALAEGDLDLARESFDKASVLAERDARVLVAIARLSATRADAAWLRVRLLADDAKEEQRLARENLGELAQRARKAADDALAVAPDDPAALRAKVDALRISGDRDGARGLVARASPSASQPEGAYLLAALDLAEAAPLWSAVVERLRVAAGAESEPGRARAALVYALARSGDAAGAAADLERLAAMPRKNELYPLLRAFVERQRPLAPPVDAGTADAAALLTTPGKKSEPSAGGEGSGDRPLPSGDPRVLVAHGEAARAKGDLDRAAQLFNAALEKNGGDTEALSGLAAVAHARRDLVGARAMYKRVLSINPSYVPSLVGLADCDWESGDRSSATRTYKEVVDRFPEGTYPPRVKQRIEAAAPAPAPAPTPTSTENP